MASTDPDSVTNAASARPPVDLDDRCDGLTCPTCRRETAGYWIHADPPRGRLEEVECPCGYAAPLYDYLAADLGEAAVEDLAIALALAVGADPGAAARADA